MPSGRGERGRNGPALLATVVFLVALTGAWVVATPMGGYPDDIDHYLRSAGVAQGQILGEPNGWLATAPVPAEKACCEAPNPAAAYWVQAGLRTVTVPASRRPERICCDEVTAQPRIVCGGVVAHEDTRYDTLMGTIEPAGYLVPGLALAVSGDTPDAFRLSRLASGWLGILAVALVLAGCARRPSFGRRLIGLGLATTPMVFFVLSSGSPNGAETAGAIGVWLAALELTSGPRDRAPAVLWSGFALSGVLLVTARSLGPMWFAFIVAVVLLLRGGRVLADRFRVDRLPALIAAALVVAAGITTVLWETLAQPHVAMDRAFAADQLGPSWADVPRVSHEVIGSFGSLDIPLPGRIANVWIAMILALGLAALATGRWRGRLAIAVVWASSLVIIVGIDAGIMRQNGFAIQGRHVLALMVGMPLLAADIIRVPRPLAAAARAVPAVLGVVCATLQMYAWVYAASSYLPGVTGRTVTAPFQGVWSVQSPAVPIALAVAAVIALAGSMFWGTLPTATRAPRRSPIRESDLPVEVVGVEGAVLGDRET